MTCPHCLRLSAKVEVQRQQIRDLQLALGLRAENGALGALGAMMDALGVTPSEALILTVLAAHRGRHCAIAKISEQTSCPTGDNVRVHVMRLRKKFGAEFIRTVYGAGYALGESGLGIVDSAMRVDCT